MKNQKTVVQRNPFQDSRDKKLIQRLDEQLNAEMSNHYLNYVSTHETPEERADAILCMRVIFEAPFNNPEFDAQSEFDQALIVVGIQRTLEAYDNGEIELRQLLPIMSMNAIEILHLQGLAEPFDGHALNSDVTFDLSLPENVHPLGRQASRLFVLADKLRQELVWREFCIQRKITTRDDCEDVGRMMSQISALVGLMRTHWDERTISIGEKKRNDGYRGQEQAFGNSQQKRQRRLAMVRTWNKMRDPDLKCVAIDMRVGKMHGCSYKTVQRARLNPSIQAELSEADEVKRS